MTKDEKAFDCIRMKDEIQKRVRQIYAGMSDEEERIRVIQELATSNDPLARKWRSLKRRPSRQTAGVRGS